jgi:1A family penicillin-binding protein
MKHFRRRDIKRFVNRDGVFGYSWGMVAMALVAFGVAFASIIVLWIATLKIPDLSAFEQRKQQQSTKIYDRTGDVLLYDVHQDIRRTVVPLENISTNVQNATIAIEDENFYKHRGIEPTSIIRAVLVNLLTFDFSQGGSTITQQVVKNSLLTREKTVSRKLKEWILALKLERTLEKDAILALYLNETPYGGPIYGVEEASRSYFNKSAKDLTLPEAAYLAAMAQAPTYYSHYGDNTDKLEKRKNLVLRRMLDQKFITKADYDTAIATTVEWQEQQHRGIKAPHFVFFVLDRLKETYGEEAVEEDGFKVITTLDWKLQEKAEALAERYAKENEKNFNAENAGIVALDPKTGEILTMVGSRDYFDDAIQGNFNVTTAKRQPGSTFKPFAYATAFSKGYTPDTVLFDLRTQFSTACAASDTANTEGDCYSPVNYDSAYRGPISMRNALAQSINIPAVKTLYLAGLKDSLDLAKNMGIETLGDWRQYGLTLVLGGGEVKLLDMTSAYGVFANEGKRVPYEPIKKIEDKEGNVIEEPKPEAKEVLPRDVALMISDVLSDNVARSPAFGASSFLNIPGVAVKTGTTNNYVDAWIIGYTPSIVVGAWAGNNDATSMSKKVAGFIVAPLWNAVMQEALKLVPAESFPEPPPVDQSIKPVLRGVWQGGQAYRIDKTTGKLATEFTPPELVEERYTGDVHSILYYVTKDDPRGPIPSSPSSDPQFDHWEFPVRAWVRGQGISETSPSAIPTETDDVHRPEFAPVLSLRGVDSSREYKKNDIITVSVESQSKFPLAQVDITLNGQPVGSVKNPPFTFSLALSGFQNLGETNEIKVTGYDSVQNRGETSTTFRFK